MLWTAPCASLMRALPCSRCHSHTSCQLWLPPALMATNFYIYYRVAAGAHALAHERVGVLLERVRRESGVHGRVLRKRGEDDLWMEIYEAVPDEAAFVV